MVRLARSGILFFALGSCVGLRPCSSNPVRQDENRPSQPKDQMFSGTVTAVDEASLTAVRTGQGKVSAKRTFLLTAETSFEGGKPKLNSRVTVRFIATEDGDRAIHVIVRAVAKGK
jgi:hypothetical protein